MPETPRRRRFQVHLSTAVVLMFVAGGLLWINAADKFDGMEFEVLNTGEVVSIPDNRFASHGWPFVAIRYRDSGDLSLRKPGAARLERRRGNHLIYSMAALDFVVALALLFVVWFLCEGQIRRAARRKGA
jgi:hypothetical protein